MVRSSRFLVVPILSILLGAASACGGSQTEPVVPETPPASPPSGAAAAPATSVAAAAASAEPAAAKDPTASSTGEDSGPLPSEEESPAAGPSAEGDTTGRNIRYVVSPEGLKVRVDGVVFTPTAEAVRMGKAWGIQVKVEAKAEDDAPHFVLAPKTTEVALAGEVRRSGQAEPEEFSDRRDGDRDLQVTPKKPLKLARTWPAKDGPKPLLSGDTLRLEVGIWGLGSDPASLRPVKKLCRIEVKFDKDKPRAKVLAPEGVSK